MSLRIASNKIGLLLYIGQHLQPLLAALRVKISRYMGKVSAPTCMADARAITAATD